MATRREDKFAAALIRRSEDVAALINKLNWAESARERGEIAIVINMRVFKYQFATGEAGVRGCAAQRKRLGLVETNVRDCC